MSATDVQATIECPFCDEDGFDLIGLKAHLVSGFCRAYDETPVATTLTALIGGTGP